MNPEDVPAELVLIAAEALMAACDSDEDARTCACPTDEQIRTIIAAVLPEVRAQAWSAGFYAATNAAPPDVWLPAWDDVTNPWLPSESEASDA